MNQTVTDRTFKLAASEPTRQKRPVDLVRDYFQDKTLPLGMRISVKVNSSRFIEQAYFTVHLTKDGETSLDPVFSGVYSAGRPGEAVAGWVDGDYFDIATFADGEQVVLGGQDLDAELFKILGGLVPAGGSMIISYSLFSKSSRVHRDTKTGLERGFPPVVTPLGFLLFVAGCLGFAERSRRGPEKLRGYKPLSQQATHEKAERLLQELQVFVSHPQTEDDLTQTCLSRARVVMHELHSLR